MGTVGRAVGLKGEVEVSVASDDPQRFSPGSHLLVSGDLRPLTISKARSHRQRLIITFEEVNDRTGAEALRGSELVIHTEATRRLEADEYWDHELVGCAVVTSSGEEVGRVTDVLHPPSPEANDVLVVQGPGGEQLVPLIRDVIRSVDPGRVITIEPIPGLLD